MSFEHPNPVARPSQVPAEILVRVGGRSSRIKYHAGDTLLETMRRAGIPAPSLCEQGVCGSCMVRLLRGNAWLRENHILSEEDLAAGYTLACQGEPRGEVCEIEIEG